MTASIKSLVRETAAKSAARATSDKEQAAISKALAPFAFKGRNATIRTTALAGIASLAYMEGQSRADTIAQLRIVLGAKPSEDEVKAAALQYVVGRTAQRLSSEAAYKGFSVADLIARALQLVTVYAYPLQDGVKETKLRKGKIGRRTPSEHRAIRAAEEAWSQAKAEVVPNQPTASTQKERNAKRSTKNTPVRGTKGKGKGAASGLTHSELVKPDGKPHDRESATQYIEAMAATLLAFCNKHAKVVPLDYGTAVQAFKVAVTAAADKSK